MSLHTSSHVAGGAARIHGPNLRAGLNLDRSPAAPEALPFRVLPPAMARAGADANRLSVQLRHMGVVISISALGDGPSATWEVAPFGSAQAEGGRAASPDGVVQLLSQALAAAEGAAEEFGGVYADAVRLAILARTLGLDPQGAQASPPKAEPAAPASALRSGLPKWRLRRVEAHVEANLAETITLADMAAAAGLSKMHFAAQFRIATGLRPHDYLLGRRIERARRMLVEGRESLVQIALAVGFQTQAHFTTVFRRFVGETPNRWRAANRPVPVRSHSSREADRASRCPPQ